MRIRISPLALAVVGLATMLPAVPADAATPERMMAECRARAGKALKTRLPNIETKYEGQRTDGTHAVNGTARFSGRTETFQCSFNRAGSRMVNFVINRTPAAAPAKPVGRGVRRACLIAVGKQTNRRGLSVISVRRGETSTIVLIRVPGAKAPWRCDHGTTGVLRVFYTQAG
ncbi:MAG: hypothetical protein R3D31_08370 [Hyphomicrobiaceae bacterium]